MLEEKDHTISTLQTQVHFLVCMFVCIYVYLLVCLFVSLYVCVCVLPVCLFVCLFVPLSVYQMIDNLFLSGSVVERASNSSSNCKLSHCRSTLLASIIDHSVLLGTYK